MLVIRRALLDYVRRPLNVVLLLAVPVVIVIALAGDLANLSKLVSTTAKPATPPAKPPVTPAKKTTPVPPAK